MSDAIKRLRERAAGHAEKLDQSVSPIDYTAIAKRDLTALLDIAELAQRIDRQRAYTWEDEQLLRAARAKLDAP